MRGGGGTLVHTAVLINANMKRVGTEGVGDDLHLEYVRKRSAPSATGPSQTVREFNQVLLLDCKLAPRNKDRNIRRFAGPEL